MEGLIMTAQLLLGLSILVGVHEFGHLIAAKGFGMRVEKFSIGFPPKIFGIKFGQTEYSLGALPLGGFVKISGMIDESLDADQMKSEAKPWEYRSKPAWQRLIVMLGGITVNIIVGILIFAGMTYIYGDQYYSKSTVNQYGIYPSELGKEIGFKQGDKVLEVNGKDYDSFNDLIEPDVILQENSYYTIERDRKRMDVSLPTGFLDRLSDKGVERNFISPLIPFEVGEVLAGSNADQAGLAAGDQIVAVNDVPTAYFQPFRQELFNFSGEAVDLTVNRNGKTLTLNTQVTEEGTIGFRPEMLLEADKTDYGVGQALAIGTSRAFGIITVQIKAFSKIFSGEVSASKSLSGPIGIAQIFGGAWQWERFWLITGMLSMVLAFMNLLPIPALDGGHVVFLLYEIVSGRAPSDGFLEGAQKVGMLILLSLMAFAFGNDIYKWILN